MTGLFDDLFALSRVQGEPRTKKQQLVSLTEVLSDVASEAAATATARQVTLDLEVPDSDRLAVLGAPDDLTRALANLVSNAIRHTEPGMRVHLTGRRADDGQIQVAVPRRRQGTTAAPGWVWPSPAASSSPTTGGSPSATWTAAAASRLTCPRRNEPSQLDEGALTGGAGLIGSVVDQQLGPSVTRW